MSAIIGNQAPRLSLHPPKLSSVGREVADLARLAKLELDPWQLYVMDQACGKREGTYYDPILERHERKWSAFEVGLVVSRQNGKGSILEARELAGLFLFGERMIIHSAHEFQTSKEAFERILMLIESCPDFDKEVKRTPRGHGEEGVEMKNGQRLRFRTRTKGGGRGFTGDCLILDEAMYLAAPQVGALMPTLSARPNAQIWYTGSAGDKESEQLGKVRARALSPSEDETRLFYAEWSIDACTDYCSRNCEDHDLPRIPSEIDRLGKNHPEWKRARERVVLSYAKSNPALGIRISLEHIDGESRAMPEPTFLQERCGVGDWPIEGDEWRVISEEAWTRRENEQSLIDGQFTLAVDTTPDRSYSCIVAAGQNEDGEIHVEVTGIPDGDLDHKQGAQWAKARILDIWKANRPLAVIIDPASQAGSFKDDLEAEGVEVVSPTSREYAQWCGEFHSGVMPRRGNEADVTHIGQFPLTAAVAGADKRKLSDMWAWDKNNSASDISPLVAATLAAGGFRRLVLEKEAPMPFVYRAGRDGTLSGWSADEED